MSDTGSGKSILDNPMITSVMFYPRQVPQGYRLIPDAYDGTVMARDDIKIGYRLYDHPDAKYLLLFFHGNGEIAADYGDIIHMFHQTGAAVVIADFRGYGWSEGKPSGSKLLTDGEDVLLGLADALHGHRAGVGDLSLFVMGRSLGSIPTAYIAKQHPDKVKGIIIESGLSSGRDWLMRKVSMGLIGGSLSFGIGDPLPNAKWVAESGLPLLVIHGEEDTLIPPDNGQAYYDQSPATQKRILRIPRAGHNDVMIVGLQQYFAAMKTFFEDVCGS